MNPKKVITLAVLLLMLIFAYYSMHAAPLISDENYAYIGGLRWYKTYENGSAVSLQENKPVLIYFWAVWCKFCKKLDTEVIPDPEVSRTLEEDFVLVLVDLDANKEDANLFGVSYPPYIIFVGVNGEIINKIPGYVPKDDFLAALKAIGG